MLTALSEESFCSDPSKDVSSSRKDKGMTLEGFLNGRNVSEDVEILQEE